MKKDESFEELDVNEEDLLNFEFDELTEEDIEADSGGSSDEGKVIELVDVVEKGDMVEELESAEIHQMLDQEETFEVREDRETIADRSGNEGSGDDELVLGISDEAIELEMGTEDENVAEAMAAVGKDEVLGKDDTQSLDLDLESALETLDSVDMANQDAALSDSEIERLSETASIEEISLLEAESTSKDDKPEVLEGELDSLLDEDSFVDISLQETAKSTGEKEGFGTQGADDGSLREESELDNIELQFDDVTEQGTPDESSYRNEIGREAMVGGVAGLPHETLGETYKGAEESVPGQDPEMMALSEERIEAIMTRVFRDVLEEMENKKAAVATPTPAAIEMSEEKIEGIMARVMHDFMEKMETEKAATVSVPPEAIEISEEKIEAVVTKVVENAIEKAARETMASVAEKVIMEAIEALKLSLETSTE